MMYKIFSENILFNFFGEKSRKKRNDTIFCVFFVYFFVELVCLGGVSENGGTIRDKQEIDSDSKSNHVSGGAGANVRAVVTKVELTGTGDVNVSGWLVSSRIQTEIHHVGAEVFGSVNIGSTISVCHVISVESSLVLAENADTMGLQIKNVNGFGLGGVGKLFNRLLSRESLMLGGRGVVGNGIIGHDITIRAGWDIKDIVSHKSKSMPITELVGVAGSNVNSGPESEEDGLDGPLQVGQQELASGIRNSLSLQAMNAD